MDNPSIVINSLYKENADYKIRYRITVPCKEGKTLVTGSIKLGEEIEIPVYEQKKT